MIYKTEAIVLNKQDFRETSLIITFYSRYFGKIAGLLKGVRKEPGKFASSMELFSLNDIIFYKKRSGTLHLVSAADIKDNFNGIRSDMLRMSVASSMLELINAIMPYEDINEDIFDLAITCLKEMETARDSERIMLLFKIKTLSLSGFKPHFDSCVSCGDRINDISKFSNSLGGLLCTQCFRKDLSSRQIFKGTIASVLFIERSSLKLGLGLGLNPQIKKELHYLLNSFLDFHVGKRLKSEKVADKLGIINKLPSF